MIDLKQKISDNLDMAHHDGGSYDIPAHLNSLNEELKVQLRETQSKLASSDALLTEKGNTLQSGGGQFVQNRVPNNYSGSSFRSLARSKNAFDFQMT